MLHIIQSTAATKAATFSDIAAKLHGLVADKALLHDEMCALLAMADSYIGLLREPDAGEQVSVTIEGSFTASSIVGPSSLAVDVRANIEPLAR